MMARGAGAVALVAMASLARPAAASDVRAALAQALERAGHGELERAEAEVAALSTRAPDSALVAREHAALLLAVGRADAARVAVERALALGDAEPEAHELHARILAELGLEAEARAAAAQAGTWEGDLIGASLGDAAAAGRASPWAEEVSPRGALAALTLAGHAAASGARTTARSLASLAEELARASDAGLVLAAARDLSSRLGGEGEALRVSALARASVVYATNPLFEVEGGPHKPQSLGAAITAELGAQAPIATARFDASLRFDQRMQLVDRARLAGLDVSGLSLAASVEVPISSRPSAALVGLAVRVHDVWGDGFTTHWATAFEGGPTLTLPFDASMRAVLGVYGVGVDFIDRSPPDAQISSQNRDRIGQRAVASLLYEAGWLRLRADAAFLRDDAYGEAFDARGGVLAGRAVAVVTDEIVLTTGVTTLVRSFGPVGDAVVLGSAATRVEARITAELGARVRLADGYYLVVEDTWIGSNGREGHSYTHNALSLGLEGRW